MPIFQYRCAFCGFLFDELVKDYSQKAYCPKCKKEAVRQWSGKVYTAAGNSKKTCSGNCSRCRGCK